MTNKQKVALSKIINELIWSTNVKNKSIENIVKIIISESIFLERYDILKKLQSNGMI
jgi:hypothetical protein